MWILINPLTLWVRWLFKKIYLEFKFRRLHISIGYMAEVQRCSFGRYSTIYKHAHVYDVAIGDYSYINKHSQVHRTTIGKFTCIGYNVNIGLGKHPTSGFVSSHPLFFSNRGQVGITFLKESIFQEYEKVEIGNDVWIGANSIIRDGVKIGNGAIVGAGSVVTKDVPPYAIVGGVPAKLIRYRFEEDKIDFLQSFKWWDKDLEWLRDKAGEFTDVELFFIRHSGI